MPSDRRPLDHVLVSQLGKPEEELIAWWKQRFEQIAAIPLASARAGALVPVWRELATLSKADRLTLSRARVLAFTQLTPDQQARILEAREIGDLQVPEIAADDTTFVDGEVVPTLPADLQQRIRAAMSR